MIVSGTMNLQELKARMSTEATDADAERMRALLVQEYDGVDTEHISETFWHDLLGLLNMPEGRAVNQAAQRPAETIHTRTANGIEWHLVSHSPRGFQNETGTVAFMERANAERFVSRTQNGDGHVISGARAALMADAYDAADLPLLWDAAEQYDRL